MTPNTAIHSLDECFAYLSKNAVAGPDDPVKIDFRMLRSLYFHISCAKFGVPVGDDVELLDAQINQLCHELACAETRR